MTSMPGVAANSSRASSTVIFCSVSTRMLSLWQLLDRHADAGRADLNRVVAQDLVRLVDHLHFFRGVALVLGRADLRNQIEGDRVGEVSYLYVLAAQSRLRSRCSDRWLPARPCRWWPGRC